jgi:hypothetical protein
MSLRLPGIPDRAPSRLQTPVTWGGSGSGGHAGERRTGCRSSLKAFGVSARVSCFPFPFFLFLTRLPSESVGGAVKATPIMKA